MSKILALLSGKGGSGKTTLALSMASMLSDCRIKVLLIDCDLITNGATYFYESRLSEHSGDITSFYKIVSGLDNQEDQLISVNKNMDFMPSITQIAKKNTDTYLYKEDDRQWILQKLIIDYICKYEVVIFDCQAGYTDVLKLILPIVDLNLVVMEADAISSAAMRSLYLKIGDLLNEKRVYQVFNKATEEEYKLYSKISGGTVFTNIETVKFDWKIRKAFSVVEIPDMKKTSADYGVQIYGICRILFKEENVQTKLDKYGIFIELNKKIERKEILEEKLTRLQIGKSNSKSGVHRIFMAISICAIGTLLCMLFFTLVDKKILLVIDDNILSIVMPIGLSVFVGYFYMTLLEATKERRNRYKQVNILKNSWKIYRKIYRN